MEIFFNESDHSYHSIDKSDSIKWVSATSLLSFYKQPFDPKSISEKSSRNAKSKWYGMKPEEIRAIWKKEADRATSLGNWYHKQREDDLLGCNTIVRYNTELPIVAPIVDAEGYKVAPEQKLTEGIYPEHMVYLKSAGVCGQSDLVEVANGKVYITDYKTNKEIKKESYRNWEGISQKMEYPVSHLDDCNLNHYNLQLSLYMYIVLKHNPKLQPGELTIHHIMFEERDEKDENGFPLVIYDERGFPKVKEVVIYRLPYLKDEVVSLLKHYQDNKEKLLAKKYGQAV